MHRPNFYPTTTSKLWLLMSKVQYNPSHRPRSPTFMASGRPVLAAGHISHQPQVKLITSGKSRCRLLSG